MVSANDPAGVNRKGRDGSAPPGQCKTAEEGTRVKVRSIVHVGSDKTAQRAANPGERPNPCTFSNWPATGRQGSVTLKIYGGGSQTITWPLTMQWPGGTAPTLIDNTATFTTDFATDDKLDITAHGLLDGEIVQVTTSAADLPAGLAIDTPYYVVNKTANDFELSLAEGGAAVDITDDGTGTHTLHSGLDQVIVSTTNGGLTLEGAHAEVDMQ